MLECRINDEANIAIVAIFSVEIKAWELGVDLFDELNELVFRYEYQRLVRIIDRPNVEPVILLALYFEGHQVKWNPLFAGQRRSD